jgi:DNA-binding response OmpR family regulator
MSEPARMGGPLLLVEDDIDLGVTVEEYLVSRGWPVVFVPNGARALSLLSERPFSLMILDHRMPELTGLDVCRRVRTEIAPALPILMITAADELEDRLAGFAAGVDDYLVKPFALPELGARAAALLRRVDLGPSAVTTRLAYGDIVIDLSTRVVERGGRRLELTRMGFLTLELLVRRAPAVVRREEVEQFLWGGEVRGTEVLRAHIYALRAALEPAGTTAILHTHRGVGYQISTDAP